MNISSLGASNIQALNLFSLLGSSTTNSEDDTSNLSLDSTSDLLSLSAQAQWMSRSQGSNPFKADFDSLGKLIESGDLAGAKKAYSAMQEKMKAHGGGSDPMASEFKAIGKALESGDSASAKAAWETMQTKLQSLGAERTASGSSNPMKDDMDQLGKLIQSGDLTAANSLFKTMQEKMQAHRNSTATDRESPLASGFTNLGEALDSGDATAALTAWKSLNSSLENSGPKGDNLNASRSTTTQADELKALLVAMYSQQSSWWSTLNSSTDSSISQRL